LSDNGSDDYSGSGEKNHDSITLTEVVDEKEKRSKNVGNDANNESLSESTGNHDSSKLWERIRDEKKRQQDLRESLHEHQRKLKSQFQIG
jgi:hypothetical protein